jgi:hypothetical protein
VVGEESWPGNLGSNRQRVFPSTASPDQQQNGLTTQQPRSAMESWKNGRKDLLEQLSKICDRIGANVVAGEFRHTE